MKWAWQTSESLWCGHKLHPSHTHLSIVSLNSAWRGEPCHIVINVVNTQLALWQNPTNDRRVQATQVCVYGHPSVVYPLPYQVKGAGRERRPSHQASLLLPADCQWDVLFGGQRVCRDVLDDQVCTAVWEGRLQGEYSDCVCVCVCLCVCVCVCVCVVKLKWIVVMYLYAMGTCYCTILELRVHDCVVWTTLWEATVSHNKDWGCW